MKPIVALHYLFAFGIELGMLFGFALFGFHLGQGGWTGGLIAAILVAAAILAWARFAAPKSATRLDAGPLLVFKIAAFGLAALVIWAAGWPVAAIGFAVLSAVDLGLAMALRRL